MHHAWRHACWAGLAVGRSEVGLQHAFAKPGCARPLGRPAGPRSCSCLSWPQVRDLIHDFYNSRYASCLAHLAALRPALALDIHLHDHAQVRGRARACAQSRPCPLQASTPAASQCACKGCTFNSPSLPHSTTTPHQALYASIRHRALVQYTAPYSSVNLAAMAQAFGTDTGCATRRTARQRAPHVPASHAPLCVALMASYLVLFGPVRSAPSRSTCAAPSPPPPSS